MCLGVIGNQDRRSSRTLLHTVPSPSLLAPKGNLVDPMASAKKFHGQRPISTPQIHLCPQVRGS